MSDGGTIRQGDDMPNREQGLRRTTAATAGIAAASLAGSLVVAGLAYAATSAARAASASTGETTTESGTGQDGTDGPTDPGSQVPPQIGRGSGGAHAQSSGS